ncbi:MAG: signal peptidase II [Calditrichaeota bacterium]|nr:MAG: signal peptidase II [Calditrichota bacterium]
MAVIIGVSVVVDQITKLIAVMTLKHTPPRSYLGDFFRLQYAENTGAMLGFGSDLPEAVRFWVLTVMVGILLLGLLVYLLFNPHLRTSQVIAFSLISGGGISNFIDRLLNDGRVVDFMNMGIGWLRTGIFNVADVLIMIGLGMVLLLGGWRERRKPASEEQSPASVPSSSNPPEN